MNNVRMEGNMNMEFFDLELEVDVCYACAYFSLIIYTGEESLFIVLFIHEEAISFNNLHK